MTRHTVQREYQRVAFGGDPEAATQLMARTICLCGWAGAWHPAPSGICNSATTDGAAHLTQDAAA